MGVRARIILAILSLVVARSGAQTLVVGSTTQQLTGTQRSAVSAFWPDGNIGSTQCGTGNYYVFAPTADPGTVGITLPNLNSWTTSLSKVNTTSNLPLGATGAFDNNYTGGGQLYYNSANGYLIELYHAEYWFGGTGSPFYASLGLAYSTNCGTTWNKLGEVISPQSARVNGGTNCQAEIGNGTLLSVGAYFYAYYMETATGCIYNPVMAVARATISSVIAAAVAGTPLTSGPGTLFMKYTGSGTWTGDGVTDLANPQNGGGAFTTVATATGGGSLIVPNVRYDTFLNDYILVYINQNEPAETTTAIEAQFSNDGLNWGNPQTLVSGGTGIGGTNALDYPSLLNTGGGDPQVIGQSFSMFYLQPTVPPSCGWSCTNVYSVALSVSGGTTER